MQHINYLRELGNIHHSEPTITEIDADFEGDAYAPILGPEFQPIEREEHVGAQGLPFAFVTYQRVG